MRNFYFLLLLLIPLEIFGQQGFEPQILEQIAEAEMKAKSGKRTYKDHNTGSNYNVVYQRLEVLVDPTVNYIRGAVTTYLSPNEPINSVTFDLVAQMQIDSVSFHGSNLTYTHGQNDVLEIFFADELPAFVVDSVSVFYQGAPASNGLGSFRTDTTSFGNPITWTLSQPFGAKEWWPCKQELTDKIDSLDVHITTPSIYKAASNGLLMGEKVDGNLTTYTWKHRYPIATYLVAFTVADYTVYTDTVALPGKDLEVLNYVYPEDETNARIGTAKLPEIMVLFDSLFGPYPFSNEKYGHAQFSRGGGMEHQTMSFMGGWNFELVVHEAAHQWFGDKVTCRDWSDIWLNEGFATYLTAIGYEFTRPQYLFPWRKFINKRAINQPDGRVFVNQNEDVSRIFDPDLSYAKAAVLLRMIRWKIGDDAFFAATRAYLEAPELAYNFANTDQLRFFFEESSGQNLGEFFNDWFYGRGYPEYRLEWGQDADNNVHLNVWQSQSNPSVDFFEMSIPIRFKGENGDVTLRFDHQFSGENFQTKLNFKVDSVFFNPNLDILAGKDSVQRIAVSVISGQEELALYPNPSVDVLKIDLSPFASVTMLVEVIDYTGRPILQQEITPTESSLEQYSLDTSSLPSGSYFLRLSVGDLERTGRFVKAR